MDPYFTSDTHYFHVNVIPYCDRPFSSIEEMNETLVANFNARVTPADTTYLLGDFALGPSSNVALVRALLNGRIILIRGNHDRKRNFMLNSGFDEVHKELVIELGGKRVYLHHQPMPQHHWQGADLHFCGHVHNKWVLRDGIYNVGVDVRGFRPVTMEEILGG